MNGRSINVTGVTGFVGWHLAEAFRDAGWEVRGVVRPGSGKPMPSGIVRVEARLDEPGLERTPPGDVSVHAAGLTGGRGEQSFHRANVETTQAMVAAANATGARLILISSQAAAGPAPAARPRGEDDPPQPLTAYGRSKLAGENIVRTSSRTDWVILRPSAIYGPRDRQFLPLFRMARRGVFLLAAPEATAFTFVHIRDVARAVVLAAGAPAAVSQTLFIGHGTPRTAGELFRILAEVMATRYRPIAVPAGLLRAVASGGDLWRQLGGTPLLDGARCAELLAGGFVCRVDRARETLGFAASIDLRDGFAETARWYVERGWLSRRRGMSG